ncbi:MAG: NAD-dependent epimerase/dehydratase family protein [Candidatus Omnitrophota bacterium]|jgi:CDP-paratose 2-epimerase|nr:MAG: NAD-dependent epimerase/dehydratase family protein [Candidatus Omnitrophota bacterium]
MKYLIVGGAGFIGSNLSAWLISQGNEIVIFDNLSRRGTEHNLAWLREHFSSCRFGNCDVRNYEELHDAYRQFQPFDVIVHLAAQVAVTTSVEDPRTDFEINAMGSFNMLETIRHCGDDPIFLFSSTNKVYGGMDHVKIVENESRYEYVDQPDGIDEQCPLDFHSPYGCSKGCADQYVRDYSRIYGLRTVVFRQSAIYGPRQFGVEDQGWAAWFSICAAKGNPLTIYGDGKQVRDLLWVEDLVAAYQKAVEHINTAKGHIFNIGGGVEKSISIWREFGPILEKEIGHAIPVSFADWRPGDQKVCIMNIEKAKKELGWEPKVGVEEGTAKLVQWVKENLSIL